MKLKCKYYNILRYWIFDFHEHSNLIIKIKTNKQQQQKHVQCFTCNASRIYETNDNFTFLNVPKKR